MVQPHPLQALGVKQCVRGYRASTGFKIRTWNRTLKVTGTTPLPPLFTCNPVAVCCELASSSGHLFPVPCSPVSESLQRHFSECSEVQVIFQLQENILKILTAMLLLNTKPGLFKGSLKSQVHALCKEGHP